MAYFLEGRPYQEKFINLLLPENLLFQLRKPGKPSLQEYLQKLYPEQFHLLDPLHTVQMYFFIISQFIKIIISIYSQFKMITNIERICLISYFQ